jgi:glycosyltransferase involved in cell wall biosynthesis
MLHATTDSPLTPQKKLAMLTEEMRACSRLMVHTHNDLNRMKGLGLVENVSLFPHGIPDWQPEEREKNRTFTLATYGFFLPHKGLLEIIDTAAVLKKRGVEFQLKMVNAEYPVPQSSELIARAKEKIGALGLEKEITLLTEYLPDEACLAELSRADLVIFPYQETGESSSAAVRYGIASGTPAAVTPLHIFDDVAPAVWKLSGTSPEAMAQSLSQIITDIEKGSENVLQMQERKEKWVEAHRYPMLGERLYHILTALHRGKA